MSGIWQLPAGVDPDRSAPARIYDYLLNGENNFPADREAAEKITALVPELRDCAWANRGFHQRAARWIAQQGIRARSRLRSRSRSVLPSTAVAAADRQPGRVRGVGVSASPR
jgi:S-adenosyl methyltransferase